MPGKVVDASVLGAIFFGESRAEEAMSLIRDADLYEPALLGYELASICVKKARLHPELQQSLVGGLAVALHTDFNWVEVDHQKAALIAIETGLSAYDASYLHIARQLGLPLITFDERLKRAYL